jgi:RNA polymerase sigma factor (TIGR02999 family)
MVPDDVERDRAGRKTAPASSPSKPVAPACATGDVTLILSRIEQGDGHAAEQLLPVVYDELSKLAAAKMAHEKPGQTLQATALVHEAYIRLVDRHEAEHWNSRGHFFAAAAETMRRILVEQARRKAGVEAGGGLLRLQISQVDPETQKPGLDVLMLHEALEKLAAKDPRKADLVKLWFFAGLTNEQAAHLLGITARTACADWGHAKAWLRVEMADATGTER